MIAWFLKLAVGSKIKQLFASPIALGAIILLLLVLWYYLFYHLPVVRQRDAAIAEKTRAVKALNDYKTEQTIISNAAIIENAQKLEQARSAASLAQVESRNDIDMVLIASKQTEAEIREKVRIEYETKLNAMPFIYSVLPQSASGSDTKTEAASTGQRLAESGGDDYTACVGLREKQEALEYGCAITTAHFNQCRALLDADALVCEREK